MEAQRRLAANQGQFVHLRGGLLVWLCPARLAWALLRGKLRLIALEGIPACTSRAAAMLKAEELANYQELATVRDTTPCKAGLLQQVLLC